jgi:N-acylneuraminate cytidylyltransferase
MKQEIVGLIPVREGSQRVKGKNFIEFADKKSLLELKIDHLKSAGCFDHIYVSSDSERAKNIALSNKVEFLNRETRMCQADVPWAEVAHYIVGTIPGDPIVVWALTTSPLFGNFKSAVDKFKEVRNEKDSLVAVLPKKSFFINKYGKGINYNLGHWHPYSQELETYYEVTGACYIGKKSDMLKWFYWFGPKPYLFEVSEAESVDVDTQQDFEIAQKLYKVINE